MGIRPDELRRELVRQHMKSPARTGFEAARVAQGAIEYALWRDALHIIVSREGNLEMESRGG